MSDRQPPLLASLEDFAVADVPGSVYYIADFLQPSTSESILATIQSTSRQKWVQLSHRRLCTFGGLLTGTARDTLFNPSPLPLFLTNAILPKFEELAVFVDSPHKAPNHVLVNEYLPGQGIMPHEDGPAYYPITATVSLGSSAVLDLYSKPGHRDEEDVRHHWRILQEPGSLLVMKEGCYQDTLHGIADVEVDEAVGNQNISNWDLLGDREQYVHGRNIRGTRVSLTYRDVKKVVKCPIGTSYHASKR